MQGFFSAPRIRQLPWSVTGKKICLDITVSLNLLKNRDLFWSASETCKSCKNSSRTHIFTPSFPMSKFHIRSIHSCNGSRTRHGCIRNLIEQWKKDNEGMDSLVSQQNWAGHYLLAQVHRSHKEIQKDKIKHALVCSETDWNILNSLVLLVLLALFVSLWLRCASCHRLLTTWAANSCPVGRSFRKLGASATAKMPGARVARCCKMLQVFGYAFLVLNWTLAKQDSSISAQSESFRLKSQRNTPAEHILCTAVSSFPTSKKQWRM